MNWIKGLSFNGKHSLNDFGLTIQSKKIEPPAPQIFKETIPFSNKVYDFSTFGSDGMPTYNERNITVKFGITATSKEELYTKYSMILRWLIGTSGKKQLIFDEDYIHYYMAQVESVMNFEQVLKFGTLEVVFTCDPLKISVDEMGDGIWDNINFLTDYLQPTKEFNINGSTEVIFYNNGEPATPTINCTSPMTVTVLGQVYNLNTGDNTPWGLLLENGKNILTFNGAGKTIIHLRAEEL